MTNDKWGYVLIVYALTISIAFVSLTGFNLFVKSIFVLLHFSPVIFHFLSKRENKIRLESEKKDFDDYIADINEKYETNFKSTDIKYTNILFDDNLLKILITGDRQFCENFDFITKWKTDNCSYVKIFTKDPNHICTIVKGDKNEVEFILSKLTEFESRWKAEVLLNVE